MRGGCRHTTDNKRFAGKKKKGKDPGDFYLFLPHMFYKSRQEGVVVGIFHVIRKKLLLSITSTAPSSVMAQEMNLSRLAPVGLQYTAF